jgi:hypothetical protein
MPRNVVGFACACGRGSLAPLLAAVRTAGHSTSAEATCGPDQVFQRR